MILRFNLNKRFVSNQITSHMSGPPPMERFFARVTDDPLRQAFEGRRPVMPWIARRPVSEDALEETWERIAATPRTGKTVAYLHVPFCSNHCLFCHFYRNSSRRNNSADYASHVIAELEREAATPLARSTPVHAVYFGGGTPTDLEAADLGRLIRAFRQCLPLAGDCEFTVEARATGFDEAKIEACIEAGAGRFSFGVQTFDTEVRQRLGRKMTGPAVAEFVRKMCERGHATIVCDLIYGLPGQTDKSWGRDLQTALDLGLDGMDLYCLTLIPGSPLAAAIKKGSIKPGAEIADQATLYAIGVETLENAGWRQLTTAHFARETRERNLYNQLIKSGATCLAFGSGAGGAAAGYSYQITPLLNNYCEASAAGRKPLQSISANGPGHAAKGSVTGGLEIGRLELAAVEEAGAPGFSRAAAPLLGQWEEAGLLQRNNGTVLLTQSGRFWHTNLVSALHVMIDAPEGAPPKKFMKTPEPPSLQEKETILQNLREQLAKNPDGILEKIAMENRVTTREVVACLPAAHVVVADGSKFEEIMAELATWGDILLIVHTPDVVMECLAPLPAGEFGHGFFNLGHGSPIRGHIRAGNCKDICFVHRPFMNMDTYSVQFFNARGGAMFKIFVRRDEESEILDAGQIEKFEKLQARYRVGA